MCQSCFVASPEKWANLMKFERPNKCYRHQNSPLGIKVISIRPNIKVTVMSFFPSTISYLEANNK